MPERKRLLSTRRVAAMLDVCTKTVLAMWRRGELPPPRLVSGEFRWFARDIDRYLEDLKGAEPPPPEQEKDKKGGRSGQGN